MASRGLNSLPAGFSDDDPMESKADMRSCWGWRRSPQAAAGIQLHNSSTRSVEDLDDEKTRV